MSSKIIDIGRHKNRQLVDIRTNARVVKSVNTADLKSAGTKSLASSSLATSTNLIAYASAKEYTLAARLLGHQNVNFWEVYTEIAQDLDNPIPQDP